ncbi:hypothetical protein T492DRAFT_988122 [Pavlovales sp. CCMP2436]|nr:hypothetical protein T492DRAFT_988122 [Pavlovales sp. CCMP2436]|mmetsp:Transcript_35312/g.88081  ORF Transcript_35312/g.88081 Transcript_35312/m.88081 type:complete len:381 (+) Transcript_35312:139-1281(+)|eukprot:CAMPEP_0179880358 /NCGR_PEP_ID=MMETSP0982-20121206/26751_1 /TAXON_ID=483367 /ORGANISM="non described non described, Strain CCMP 2436" /LENGTH=380 /DNA_ID=CAMNT_0021773959 /DNA_START=95 /DNA_END=1237 /DNA_ORIENTATION=+
MAASGRLIRLTPRASHRRAAAQSGCSGRGARGGAWSLHVFCVLVVAARGAILVDVPARGAILVDVRERSAYVARHLTGASSIPLAELEARLYELPAPSEDALSLCGADARELGAAAELLRTRGWIVEAELELSCADVWSALDAGGWPEAAPGCETSQPSWRPNLFLRERLEGFLAEARAAEALAAVGDGGDPSAISASRVALDLGAGNGRDAVFMAELLGGGWEVVAIDNNIAALKRCEALADKAGVGSRVRLDARNLRRASEAVAGWTNGEVRVAHGSRFLVKALLLALRDQVLLEPGSLFIWTTFLEPSGEEENLAPPFRPSRRLRRGELAALFTASEGWGILADEEGVLTTRGEHVPSNFFAAVRLAFASHLGVACE